MNLIAGINDAGEFQLLLNGSWHEIYDAPRIDNYIAVPLKRHE
jgi:hypothetical protein